MSEKCFHIIGRAGRRRSAAFVMLYLADRFGSPHTRYPKEAFQYRQVQTLDGIVQGYDLGIYDDQIGLEKEHELLEACRAFCAALGEMDIWA